MLIPQPRNLHRDPSVRSGGKASALDTAEWGSPAWVAAYERRYGFKPMGGGAATATPPRATARRGDRGADSASPAISIPFTAAAHEHTEPAFDVTVTPGAAAVNLGPFDVPAYGYARHIYLEVTASGGTLGAGVLAPDYPWCLFQSIQFTDVNGAPIFGPYSGYQTLWANIVGQYAANGDPRTAPWYVSTINAQFPLRIPLEIAHHDGLGSLANQNSAASYKVSFVINPSTSLYSTAPTTIPAFRIRGYLEAWTLPNEVDVAGRPQAQAPPALGTAQFWSYSNRTVSAGNNTILLPRVGNLIRNIVFIARNTTAVAGIGTRDDTVFPNPAQIQWDARIILNDTQNYRNHLFTERTSLFLAAATSLPVRDAGVFVYQFNHAVDNKAGDDTPTLWLPTVQSTRLELDGTAATAGTVDIMVNDIALGEVSPSERYVEASRTGFHPEVGVQAAGAL